jgi:hypothetical protein
MLNAGHNWAQGGDMTALVWDKSGERTYQTGVDRGVLYLQNGSGVAWNGITSVEETSTVELKSFYLDGVKYLDNILPGDFSGKLKAFTYPEEFDSVNGIVSAADGLFFYDQPSKSFNLSYRTRVGNDLDGIDHGYKIHLLYNLVADPDTVVFPTLTGTALQPIEFSWTLSGTPPRTGKYRPTVHVAIDSNDTPLEVLQGIEDILYGSADSDPYFPSMNELLDLFASLGSLVIIDNGDGTWKAIDASDNYVTMVNPTTFQIDNANVVYLDATTYQISTTNPD